MSWSLKESKSSSRIWAIGILMYSSNFSRLPAIITFCVMSCSTYWFTSESLTVMLSMEAWCMKSFWMASCSGMEQ